MAPSSLCRAAAPAAFPKKRWFLKPVTQVEVEQLFFLKNDGLEKKSILGTSLGANYVTSLFLGGCTIKARVDFCVTNPWDLESFFFPSIPITQGYFVFFIVCHCQRFSSQYQILLHNFLGLCWGPNPKVQRWKESTMNVKKSRVWVLKTLGQLFQKHMARPKSDGKKNIKQDFPAKLGNGNLVFEPPIWKMLHNQIINSPILGVNMKNYLQV